MVLYTPAAKVLALVSSSFRRVLAPFSSPVLNLVMNRPTLSITAYYNLFRSRASKSHSPSMSNTLTPFFTHAGQFLFVVPGPCFIVPLISFVAQLGR